MDKNKGMPAQADAEQAKSKHCIRPRIAELTDEENSVICLSYGMEKIFEQLLLSEKSNISLKKRMELLDSLRDEKILSEMPASIAKAYIKSSQRVYEFYYHLKKLK